jgi:transmembrane sensor
MEDKKYTVSDFLLDESFQEWVKNPGSSHEAFWDKWLESNPVYNAEVSEARKLLLNLDKTNKQFSQAYIDKLWAGIELKIDEDAPQPEAKVVSLSQQVYRHSLKIAASLLLLFSIGFLLVKVWHSEPTLEYAAGIGEIKSFYLPDSSKVTLNSNSTLQVGLFKEGTARVVWLDGEAFFDVKKGKNQEAFVVHTHQYDIEVLGTSFNVKSRELLAEVALVTGQVKLTNMKAEKDKEMLLKPGDLVRVTPNNEIVAQEVKDIESYNNWTDGNLYFNRTSLSDAVRQINELYGLKIGFDDEEIAEMTYSGTLGLGPETPDVFLILLNESFGIEAKEQDGEVRLYFGK